MFHISTRTSIAILATAAVLSACSTTKRKPVAADAGLSRSDAEYRARFVSAVDYDLKFELSATETAFKGQEEIRFDLSSVPKNIFLDFEGGAVVSLETNGTSSKISYDGHRLNLSSRELKVGRNAVLISFTREHNHDGVGFHRFVDPTDKNVYLYTDMEPFQANQVFPSFDQPDLKARFRVRAAAPKAWEVVSYAMPDTTDVRGEEKIWNFPWSPRFSTYVFSLHAGPYKVWKSKAGNIPIRLFARQSLASLVDADEWLKVTGQGLKFYQDYFGYEYPFVKYDQLLVPEFNAGAMENVAAVTFSERHVFRSKATFEQREDRADTILHEMAHMWFGDLVTMRWWDGLWLNESFATYLSSIALTRATEFKTAWRSFYADTKSWAYWTDELVTTHPIQTPVANTDEAFANFDGITYGKGASSLKQLHFLIGEEAFRKGLQTYFQRYAFKNTELHDFISSLESTSGRSLSSWVQEWLTTAGLNALKVTWACDAQSLKEVQLAQTAPENNPTLREHKTQLVFLQNSSGKLIGKFPEVAEYAGSSTRHPLLKPTSCPVAVYPNFEDQDYVKVLLDLRTRALATIQLAKIQDPWLRNMMTQSLWNQVRDGEWDLKSYLKMVYSQFSSEKDDKTLSAMMDSLGHANGYLERRHDVDQIFALENFLFKGLRSRRPGSDAQALYFHMFITTARSPGAQQTLREWLLGKNTPKGLSFGQDRRWSLVKRLSQLGATDSEALAQSETQRENNDFAHKAALASQALRPVAELKATLWKRVLEGHDSLDDQRQIMRNLFPFDQGALHEPWAAEYFRLLPVLAKERDEGFMSSFVRLVPTTCTSASVARLSDFIKRDGGDLPHSLLKELRISLQEDECCVKIVENREPQS